MTINMERISSGWKMDVNCNSGEDKPTTAVTPRAYGDLERGRFCFSTQTMLFLFSLLEETEIIEIIDEFREIVTSAEPTKMQEMKTEESFGNKVV